MSHRWSAVLEGRAGVLMLHGYPSRTRAMRTVVAALAKEARYRSPRYTSGRAELVDVPIGASPQWATGDAVGRRAE